MPDLTELARGGLAGVERHGLCVLSDVQSGGVKSTTAFAAIESSEGAAGAARRLLALAQAKELAATAFTG